MELLSDREKDPFHADIKDEDRELNLNHRRGDYVQSPLYTHLILRRMQYLPPQLHRKHPRVQLHHKDHHEREAEILLNIGLHVTSKQLRTSSKSGTSNISCATQNRNPQLKSSPFCPFKLLLPINIPAHRSAVCPQVWWEKHPCHGTVGLTPKESRLMCPQHCSVQNHSSLKCYF